ncbi:DUF732 domain-containing protein [Mycobacterium sp.]|uniref:DUF732 domain-containing protein n=1 Tax=Mycobacterium sp. TaxID=1785 RepID=UPI0025CFE325|nr:DUF732 domain-containing protein [Mycobacterium sp.]MBW0012544.1 DUF732 domain-containing protein [Mycobacterium sp.]
MFSFRISTVATTTIGAAAIALAAFAGAGTAAASTPDDTFIAQMTRLGVTFSSPQEAVRQGHQVCTRLAAGKTGLDVFHEVLGQGHLTPKQAAHLVIDATDAYCPDLSGQLMSKIA